MKWALPAALLLALLGWWRLQRTVASFDLAESGPEHVIKRDLATLRLAVEEYHEVNRKWPAKLDDALMSLPSRPMRERPKSAKWGYDAASGHVFVDSTATDSRGNAWNAY